MVLIRLRYPSQDNAYRRGLLTAGKGITERVARLRDALSGPPRSGQRQAARSSTHSADGPDNAVRLDGRFLWAAAERNSKRRLHRGVISSQDVLGPIGILRAGSVETGPLRSLDNLHAAILLGYCPGRWFGFPEGQQDGSEGAGIVDTEDILYLGKGGAVGRLIFGRFPAGMAAVPPIPNEELLGGAV